MRSDIQMTDFHSQYYKLLDMFAHSKIRKLIISIPPQHGKSLGASELLPAYLLGLDPDLNICIGSYGFSLARRFGASVRRLISNPEYARLFPKTYLKGTNLTDKGTEAAKTAEQMDIVGANGGLRLVGRQGPLTGCRVDVMIMDDLYKDMAEACSPIIRHAAWDWYTSVVRTRLHNDSREIIVFTRWHTEDIVGNIAKIEKVVEIRSLDQLDGISDDTWVKINFPALKTTNPDPKIMHPIDPRNKGEALWPERHSSELLKAKKRLDPHVFEALYQGNPMSAEGLLYSDFKTYDSLPSKIVKMANYTDTADTGGDFLCSICYAVGSDSLIYITEVIYTEQSMEITEPLVAEMIERNATRIAYIESNNGGRGFARAIVRTIAPKGCTIESFHQSASKESRILTNATTVNSKIHMPHDWQSRWGDFAENVTHFRRTFSANKHDDAPDALTGIIEKEFFENSSKIQKITFRN